MTQAYTQLLTTIDALKALHEKHECVWADFFASCKDRLDKDLAFGCDYLITAYGGMFNYEEFGTLPDESDETLRLQLAKEAYNLAKELKQ